ncbi:MAG: pantoate--beta-alanine ligase [Acidobacteriia bacterium]|nr:pantoate--beta-alanine ligase [Terriglobia bacterium]
MTCVRTIAETRCHVAEARRTGLGIALVPTMGALHPGHGVLIDWARRPADFRVVSIFVNPTQFDRREDFEAYAINLNADLEFCAARGVDLVFAPSAAEMYPVPLSTRIEVTGLADHLCGPFRPGHFQAVATVVAKLFQIVAPDRAYFGEKDAQQLAVIQRMVADLNMPIEIVPVPTVREPDGLALSSRNARLTPEQRAAAPILYRSLERALQSLAAGSRSASEVRQTALEVLAEIPPLRVEYLEVVDAATLAPVETVTGPVLIAAAVWLGATRLIDNVAADVRP